MVYLNRNDSKLHPTRHSSRGHKSNCWVATAWRRSSPTSRWLPWERWNPCEESLPKWMGSWNGCWRPPKFGNIRVDFAKMKLDFLIQAGDLRNNIRRLQHDLLLSNLTIETSNTLWLEISILVCQDSKTKCACASTQGFCEFTWNIQLPCKMLTSYLPQVNCCRSKSIARFKIPYEVKDTHSNSLDGWL